MAMSRRALFGKLDLTLFRALESATAFAKLRGNPHVELIHWLQQLSQANDGDLQRIWHHAHIDPAVLAQDFQAALHALPSGATSLVDFSHHLCESVEQAWVLASLQFADSRIRGAWLLAALLKTPDLRAQLLAASPALRVLVSEGFADTLPAIVAESPESHEAAHDGSGLRPAVPGEASAAVAPPSANGSALEKYTTDLTALAANGDIDPVVGREHEIRTAIDILLRRRQNNPLLTGDAGVGKTAVVEGLALAIARGSVPPPLRDVRLLSLDVGALIAGASMRGEFESRLKRLLEEARQSPRPVVLFVDEIHTLIGAGGQAGTGDAANLLKPALARGGLRTIGATTWSEYKRHIEKDPALTRRFQVLQVPEPAEQAAIDMLRGLVGTFSSHHGVLVLDEAVRAAVLLSQRYIPARQLPDKAISLLDTACARVAMSLHTPPGPVESSRQRVAALQCELDLLAHEGPVVRGQVQRAERLQAARAELRAAQALLDQQEQHWRDEGELVQAVLRLRSQTADAAAAAELEALEQRLQALQGDTPQVHPQVDEAVVAAIVADWTGIPAGRMLQDEAGAVLGLHARLAQRVVGQDRALEVIAQRIQTSRAGLTDPGKPVGIFLLVGPSGVGKTETALTLADALYGGEQNLITINMSEYLGALSRAQRSQMDWLFLLTRLLAGADSAQTVPGRVEALSSAIDTQWQAHAPDMRCALVAAHAQSHALRMTEAANGEQRPALPDPAADLQGVRFLPWSDWPRSLLKPPYRAAFWQQDANGGFIDAAEQLGPLWIERP